MKDQSIRYSIHDLAEAQRRNYVRFLTNGLKSELDHFPPIRVGWLELIFHSSTCQIRLPREKASQTIKKQGTISVSLYVAASLIDHYTGQIIHCWIPISRIPLILGAGGFYVRGIGWIVVHQIIRAPGPYNEILTDKNEKRQSEIILLSEVGSRIYIKHKVQDFTSLNLIQFFCNKYSDLFNNSEFIEVSWGADDTQKIPAALLLSALGLPSNLFSGISNPYLTPKRALNLIKKNIIISNEIRNSNTTHIYYSKRFGNKSGINETHFINQKSSASSKRLFGFILGSSDAIRAGFIGTTGRMRLNTRYGLSVTNQRTINGQDLAYLVEEVYIAKINNFKLQLDDRDNLKNRYLRSCGDLLQACWRCGFIKGRKSAIKKLVQFNIAQSRFSNEFRKTQYQRIKPIQFHINPISIIDAFRKPIEDEIRIFFSTNPLSQWWQYTNPLESLTHTRRCTSLGPGGLSRDRASIAVRNIHPSHFGRICPIETPEGKNVGVVNSPALGTRVDSYGFLLPPYFRVQHNSLITDKNTIYLHPSIDAKGSWVTSNELIVSPSGKLPNRRQRSRYIERFSSISPHLIDLFGVTPPQMLSVGAGLIPFVEHNDGNRALMGSNMQRQALPLIQPERPIVGTGLEPIVASDSRATIRAIASGYVYWTTSHEIRVHSILHWRSGQFRTIKYKLGRYIPTPKGTFFDNRPWVEDGDWVQTGDLIADAAGCSHGDLALGRNLIIAYTPWEGYNYEDSVLINERLVDQDLITSIHIKPYSATLPEVYSNIYNQSIGNYALPPSLSGHYDIIHGKIPGTFLTRLGVLKKHQKQLDKDGVIHIGSWVKPGNILIGIIELLERKKPVSGARQLVIDILGDEESRRYRDHSLRVPNFVQGRVIDVRGTRPSWSRLIGSHKESIHPSTELVVYVAQRCQIRVGDKIAGRHGNKGVIAKIVPQQDMPYLASGLSVDIVLNPLGVPSRMNVGQIYEGILGLAGRLLGQHYRVIPFDEIYGSETSYGLVHGKLLEAQQRLGLSWIFNPQAPGKTYLFDGRTGEPLEQLVLLTTSYILKLEHRVDEKIHARTTGPYALSTQQPVRGRSRQGGQRLGEIEVWALEGFGASYTLHEILTTKSDDIKSRRAMSIRLSKGIYGFRPQFQSQSEAFKVLILELRSLCLNLTDSETDPSDFN